MKQSNEWNDRIVRALENNDKIVSEINGSVVQEKGVNSEHLTWFWSLKTQL